MNSQQKQAERTRKRRERIAEYYKQRVIRYLSLRDQYLKEEDPYKRKILFEAYEGTGSNTFSFQYGVVMADPDGKWSSKFNKVYEDAEKAYEEECANELKPDI